VKRTRMVVIDDTENEKPVYTVESLSKSYDETGRAALFTAEALEPKIVEVDEDDDAPDL
jgi:hypothetical protein